MAKLQITYTSYTRGKAHSNEIQWMWQWRWSKVANTHQGHCCAITPSLLAYELSFFSLSSLSSHSLTLLPSILSVPSSTLSASARLCSPYIAISRVSPRNFTFWRSRPSLSQKIFVWGGGVTDFFLLCGVPQKRDLPAGNPDIYLLSLYSSLSISLSSFFTLSSLLSPRYPRSFSRSLSPSPQLFPRSSLSSLLFLN